MATHDQDDNLHAPGAQNDEALNSETPRHAYRQLVTPSELRFVRSHYPVPRTHGELRLEGAFAHPGHVSVAQLRELPSVTHTVTTECAGNHRTSIEPHVEGEPFTGGAVSTSQWTGAPLERLLSWAGLKETAVEVAFHGADREYVRSLPLSKALEFSTIVAWEMNGQNIPAKYGGPIRLIVPDWYGMASVKWLTRIEALEKPFEGRYQTDQYTYAPGVPVTTMRVKSMFLDPEAGSSHARGRIRVRGLAWGGEGGVVRVDVHAGRDWEPARLLGPALPHAWHRWEFDWDARKAGKAILRCRARDARGDIQPEKAEWNRLGYGANPIQQIMVTIT